MTPQSSCKYNGHGFNDDGVCIYCHEDDGSQTKASSSPSPSSDIDHILSFGYDDPAFINDVHALIGPNKVPEARKKLLQWADKRAEAAIDDYMQGLKDMFRDYCKKYPDADINDFIGLIVGVRNQPQRISSLTTKTNKDQLATPTSEDKSNAS